MSCISPTPSHKEESHERNIFFEKVTGLRRQREEQQTQQYADIITAIAFGTEPDPEEVERILSQAGKSVNDLKADVDKAGQRMALRALAESLPTLQAGRDELVQQIRKLDADFAKAEEEHDEARFPIEDRLRQCDQAIREATRAREDLVATCEDPALLAELEQVESELERLTEQNRDLLSQAAYIEDKADTERARAEKEVTDGDRGHRIGQAKTWTDQAKMIRKRIKSNDQRREALELRRSEIEQRMREA